MFPYHRYNKAITGLLFSGKDGLGAPLGTFAEFKSQQLYHVLFEQNPEIVLLVDPHNGAIVDANQAACTFYGYSREAITLLSIHQLDHLSTNTGWEEAHQTEMLHYLASGEAREVSVQCQPLSVGDQKLLYLILRDLTLKKEIGKEVQQVNTTLQERLIALSEPLTDLSNLRFEDLFNLEDIQAIQDTFSNATGVASIITGIDGEPITRPSNFCHFCNDVVRGTKLGMANCMKSDAVIGSPRTDGPTVRPCLSAGLLDAGASIMVGDHHIANWLIGQVLDANADPQEMLRYANEIGVEEGVYRAALANVRKMPYEQFEKVSQALFLISTQLSQLAVQNIQQARVIYDREQAQQKLARVNRLYAVSSRVSQASAKVQTAHELYEKVCQILIDEGQFRMVWIGLLDPDSQEVKPAAWAGEEQGYLKEIVIRADQSPEGSGPGGASIRKKQLVVCNDIETDPGILWRTQSLSRGYRSLASFPLTIGTHVIGSMLVYSSDPGFFDDEELRLLEEISATISFALESIEKEKRRRKAEADLLLSEEKYRRLFSGGNDAIFVFPILENGEPGTFLEVNQVACERLGYTAEELLDRTLSDVIYLQHQDEIQKNLKKLLEEKSILLELDQVTKEGNRIPAEVNSRVFEYLGQLHVLAIARDITERKLAEQKIQNQIQRLSALRAIDTAINMKMPLPSIMEVVLNQVIEQLDVSAAAVLIYDAGDGSLYYGYGKGFETRMVERTCIQFEEGWAGAVVAQHIPGEILDIAQITHHTREELLAAEGFVSYYGSPLIANGAMLGVLEIYHQKTINREQVWFDYLETLAGQVAIAIEDARMVENLVKSNQELSQAYDETIAGWSRALDLRDRETEGHSKRVTTLTLRLAKEMGLPDTEFIHLQRGALLHDIGKVGVPDYILLKPDKLTPEEMQVMRRHPQYAVDLLSPITFLRPALPIPHYHHEKWDGTGYPHGLKEKEIPLPARIFAVVDVWDALLSDRPYRRGWPVEEVITYLQEQSGKHFDPEVVATFLTFMENRSTLSAFF